MADGSRASGTPLRVRVPASTSNLGPGFDLLGLALSLEIDVRATRIDAENAHTIRCEGSAADELPNDDANLIVRAFRVAAEQLDLAGSVQFEVQSDVPVARGFGSSGASIVAGLLLANEMAARTASLDELLAWGIELDGHPDNVAASLFGGCTLCHPSANGGAPIWIHNAVHPSIGFALAWPSQPLATERARAGLSKTVSMEDAIENPRRLALLLEGLRSGAPELLRAGGEDRLHVDARIELIPGSRVVLVAARESGAWMATISGAGSGMIALGPLERIGEIASAMEDAFRSETGWGAACVVCPVNGTPTVES